jgi:translation initiation factor IF-1
MTKPENIEITGEVTLALPNTLFKVKLAADAPDDLAGKEILCTLAGKMRLYRIRVMPGDRVKVEMTPYDQNRGRIVFRDK